MYESFYKLKEKPFTLLPDPGFLFLSKKHQMALSLLEYGLNDHAGFTVISGEIGAGKTTLIRHMLNNMEHEYTVGLISNTHRSFGELLQWILLAFNLDHKNMSKVEMYQRFTNFIIDEYAQNRRTVLIVDEAQNMDAETLEELRMLSNINADKDQALQVILVGQRELRETLKRPDLIQFAQRITVDYHLEPLSLEETTGYIRHRMQTAGGDPNTFSPAACAAVHRYSNGVPRLINLLCDTALVYGYAEQSEYISAALVTDVAREKQQGGIFPIYAVAQHEPGDDEMPRADETVSVTENAAPVTTRMEENTGPDVPEATQQNTAPRQGPVAIELAPLPAEANEPPRAAAIPGSAQPESHASNIAAVKDTFADRNRPQAQPAMSTEDEYRWLHGDKKKIHVVVCSAKEDLRRYLSRLLEGYGFDIAASIPIEAAPLSRLDPSAHDVLLIDRDTSNPLPQDAAGIIAVSNKPVLYNDSSITARSLRDGNPDFGLQLSERIQSLFTASGAGIAAVK